MEKKLIIYFVFQNDLKDNKKYFQSKKNNQFSKEENNKKKIKN